MRKLIKKYQLGGGIGNLGALDLTPKIDASVETLRKQASSLKLPNTETPGNFTESGIGTNFFQKIGGWDTISAGTSVLNSLIPKVENSGGYENVDNIMGIASQLPVIGKYAGMARFAMNALNSLGASRLAEVKNDQTTMSTLAGTGGGYGDFMANWDKASQLSGKKVGLFSSKSSLNDKIYEANRQMSVLQGIIGNKQQDDLLTAQMGDRWNERTMRDMNGGFGNISFGRLGLKIEYLKHFHEWQKQPKVVDTLTEFKIPEFKEGGKMNVIPEGSLHARLHHMENAEGLTKKGIPVVSEKEGGELEQQAEIELNEIIFTLEVTQEIEKLMKDGSDNAAIECGKLLVKEIFENTDDRTGLIDTLKPEEKKQTTEDVVKNHQVFQKGGKTYPHWTKPKDWTEEKIPYEEWIKDLSPNEYNGNYDLETAYKYYPKEDLERWKWAATRPTEDEYNYYMDYQDKDGRYIYHLGSIAPIPETEDFIFLKKGREENNPELHFETDGYWNGENGLRDTHDLRYEGDRYYYRKRSKKK